MASRTECDSAMRSVVDKLAELDPELRRRYTVDRSVSCRVSDLGVTYFARLSEDGLAGLVVDGAAAERAQVRLTVGSDDLLALVEGRLAVPSAWAVGKLRVQASPLDLLKLRALL